MMSPITPQYNNRLIGLLENPTILAFVIDPILPFVIDPILPPPGAKPFVIDPAIMRGINATTTMLMIKAITPAILFGMDLKIA